MRWLLLVLLVGCNLQATAPPTATLTPTLPPTETPLPSPTPPPEGWSVLAAGLEQRLLSPPENIAYFQTVRINPAQYVFRAHYSPGNGLSLNEWRERLPDATLIINANFYTPQETVLGLLVSEGQVYGQSYVNRGGTFVVENGVPRVRSTTQEPYRGESLEQAVQGFPMLVLNNQQAYTDPAQTRSARRTVIGQDAQGRIVLMVTPLAGMGLTPMSAYLADLPELNLQQAFNLDGGGSVMMWLAPSEYALPSLDAVPAVLAVYPR